MTALCLVAQPCLTLATPRTAARQAPLSFRILLARILEWVAMLFSRGSSHSRDWTQVFCISGGFFTDWATGEAPFCLMLFDVSWAACLLPGVQTLGGVPVGTWFCFHSVSVCKGLRLGLLRVDVGIDGRIDKWIWLWSSGCSVDLNCLQWPWFLCHQWRCYCRDSVFAYVIFHPSPRLSVIVCLWPLSLSSIFFLP